MKKLGFLFAAVTICWLHSACSMAQLNVSTVSVDVGLIKNFHSVESKYSVYPELQIVIRGSYFLQVRY